MATKQLPQISPTMGLSKMWLLCISPKMELSRLGFKQNSQKVASLDLTYNGINQAAFTNQLNSRKMPLTMGFSKMWLLCISPTMQLSRMGFKQNTQKVASLDLTCNGINQEAFTNQLNSRKMLHETSEPIILIAVIAFVHYLQFPFLNFNLFFWLVSFKFI